MSSPACRRQGVLSFKFQTLNSEHRTNNYIEGYEEWLKIRSVKMDQLTTGLSDASGPSITNSSFPAFNNNWYFSNTLGIV